MVLDSDSIFSFKMFKDVYIVWVTLREANPACLCICLHLLVVFYIDVSIYPSACLSFYSSI